MASSAIPLVPPDNPSSAITSIGHDGTSRLMILFNQGRSVTLEGVPPDVFAAFKAAKSPGKFYNTDIKGKYHAATSDTSEQPF